MTITTYTDREIKLQKELALEKQLAQLNGEIAAELKAERDTLRQQLAEAQALIEASRKQEAVAWKHLYKGKEIVYYPYINRGSFYTEITPLYAAPVVADDVLKDAQRYRWFRDNSSSISWNPSRFNAEIVSGFAFAGTGYLGFNFEDAINAAMGDAA